MSERPLKILFVAPYPPSQIRVRPFQIIRALARAGHRVTLAALDDGLFPSAAREEMGQVCQSVHLVPLAKLGARLNALLALPTPTPLWAAYCHSSQMARLLRKLTQEDTFDVVHIEHLRAAHFVADVGSMPTVWDSVDCLTDLQAQMKARGSFSARALAWEEWVKLRAYEPQIARQFARVAVTSNHDAHALEALGTYKHPISVIPNGVDLEYFRSNGWILPQPDTLIFSGKMSYRANEDAARFLIQKVLPRLRALRPQAHLILAGSDPSPDLRALAERVGGVTVTGYVSDLRPFLSQATLAICPMRIGVGIQNKVLEACAMARAVVCTPLAARALSLEATATQAVQVGETLDELAHLCARLLGNPPYALQVGRDARAYVEKYHHWETAAQSFVHLYNEAMAAGHAVQSKP